MKYILAWLIVLGCAFGAFAQQATTERQKPETLNTSTEPRHVRVTWMENPTAQAVVSWSTTLPGATHKLHYDTQSRKGNVRQYAHNIANIHSGEYTQSNDDVAYGVKSLYYHHAFLNGLKPNTTYYFVVVSDKSVSREFHFVTAPDDDRPIRVLFGGDSRIGGRDPYLHEDRRNMNLRMAALAEAHADVIAFCHGGDYYQRAELRYMEPWMTDHELAMPKSGRIIPIIPARGNHDRAIGFEEMFYWPDRKHDYYFETRLSKDVALITLNTEISLAGDQRAWLDKALEEARPNHRWLFVQYHKPAYSSVRGWTDGEDRRHYWVPLFERYHVDLVCESHDHALKRTLPIRQGGPHTHGIPYIGDGGLGVPQRKPDASRWYLQAPGITNSVHHVHLLEFEKDSLRGRAFGMEGELLDDFTLKPGQTDPSRAAAE